MPRRRAKFVGPRPPKGEQIPKIEISEEEGIQLNAHTAGVKAMWRGICRDGGIPETTEPCHHARAAMHLLVPEACRSIADTVYERAGLPVPDAAGFAAPLGDWDHASICAHVLACTEPSPITPIRVWWTGQRPVPPQDDREPTIILALPHEEAQARSMGNACTQIVRELMEHIIELPLDQLCEHLVCGVRRQYGAKFPQLAANERTLMTRAGLTFPEVSDPVVEAWFGRLGADEAATVALREHVQSCPMKHDKSRWPLVEFVVDKNVRPVPLPTATGVKLEWSEPVWS